MARPILTLSKPLAPAPTPAPTPAPAPPRPSKNALIPHPNGGNVFGTLPPNLLYGLPDGDIYLKYGEHRGKNRGFGEIHIWREHQHDLTKLHYAAQADVARYVADIIRPGAPIHFEGSTSAADRLVVLRSLLGLVIIEFKPLAIGNMAWSVITAFPSRQAHGKLVGNIL